MKTSVVRRSGGALDACALAVQRFAKCEAKGIARWMPALVASAGNSCTRDERPRGRRGLARGETLSRSFASATGARQPYAFNNPASLLACVLPIARLSSEAEMSSRFTDRSLNRAGTDKCPQAVLLYGESCWHLSDGCRETKPNRLCLNFPVLQGFGHRHRIGNLCGSSTQAPPVFE